MFGKISLAKAEKILRSVFKKLRIEPEIEIKDNRVVATVGNMPIKRVMCNFVTVILYRDGSCLISTVVGKTDITNEKLVALNKYNEESMGWRAYIDEEGYLNFDYDNFYVAKGKIKKFLRQNIRGAVDEDTEQYFMQLCTGCN